MRLRPAVPWILASMVIAAATGWLQRTAGADTPALRVVPAQAELHRPASTPVATDARPTKPGPWRATPDVAPAPTDSLAAKVDRWSRSPDPADAMRAYEAVFQCLQTRRDERRPSEEIALRNKQMEEALPEDQRAGFRAGLVSAAATCRDLRSDQIQDRNRWLARAARAGMPLAALDFILEGPDGDGLLQDVGGPKPVPTQAWIDQRDAYIGVALRHCDLALEGYLAMNAPGDAADVGQALNFWQARLQCGGPAPRPSLMDDAVARRYLRGLLPPAPDAGA
jgi:hypothetical protein